MASLLGFRKKVVSSPEEKLKNAKIRRNLSQEFAKAVKILQQKNAITDEVFYSTETTDMLCCILEAMFLHGLKDSTSQSFWKLVSKFTHSDVITQIKEFSQISSEIGYCRAWVRVALNDGLMESYVHSMVQDKGTLRNYYTPVAFLRDIEAPDILRGILSGMQNLQFQLSTNSTVLNLWPREPLVLAGYLEQKEDPAPVIRDSPGPEADAARTHSGSLKSTSSNDENSATSAASAVNPVITVDRTPTQEPIEPSPSSLEAQQGPSSVTADSSSLGTTSSARSTPVSFIQEAAMGTRFDLVSEHSEANSLGSSPAEGEELAIHIGGERRKKGKSRGQEHHHHHSSSPMEDAAKHLRSHSLEDAIHSAEEKVLRSSARLPKEGTHLLVGEGSDSSNTSGHRCRSCSPKARRRKSPTPHHGAHAQKKETPVVSDVSRTEAVPPEGAVDEKTKVKSSDENDGVVAEKDSIHTAFQKLESADDSTKSEDLDATVLDYRSLFPSSTPKQDSSLRQSSSQKELKSSASQSSLQKELKSSAPQSSLQKELRSSAPHSNILPPGSVPASEGVRNDSRQALPEASTKQKSGAETRVSSQSDSAKPKNGTETRQSSENDTARPKSSASSSGLRRLSSSSSPPGPGHNGARRSSGCPGLKAKGEPISSAVSPVLGDQLEAAGVEKSDIGNGVLEELRQGQVRRGSKPVVEPVLRSSPVIGNSLNSRQGWSSSFEAEYNYRHPQAFGSQDSQLSADSPSPPSISIGGAVRQANQSQPESDSPEDADVETKSVSSLEHGFIELQQEEPALDLSQIAQESSLVSQNMKCHGCSAPIGYIYGEPLVCSLDGHSYCSQCHQGDEALIPAFILHNWDFRKYPVSKANYAYLQEVYDSAEFNLEEVSPELYETIVALEEVKELRTQLRYLKTYLYTCKESIASDLRKKVWPKEYLYLEPDLYTITDLLNVINGQMAKMLREIIKFATKHVYKCPLCSERGFICELCHNPKIIYPFEIETTYRCEDCSAVYHRMCKTDRIPCPKCQRRQKMALRSIPRAGSSAFDLMDYAYSPEHDL